MAIVKIKLVNKKIKPIVINVEKPQRFTKLLYIE